MLRSALCLALLLSVIPFTAYAEPGPVCVDTVGDAELAYYGPLAVALCNALDAQGQFVYGRRVTGRGTLECSIVSDHDVPAAFTSGGAIVVFDLSLTGYSTATALCSEALGNGRIVIDKNWDAYAP